MVKQQKFRLLTALGVSLVSEIRPVPGLLGAALVFPQGIEGDHGYSYLALAMVMNFAVFFAATYFIVGLFIRRESSN